jgi:NADPH:quinone reductase-like Zn-dependent oxidoreductase
LSEFRRVLTPKGKYVMVGGGGANEQGVFGKMPRTLQAKLLSKSGGQEMGWMLANPNQKDMATLADLMQSGKVKPVIDRAYKLSDLPEAIRYVEEGHARGKVVITVD